MRMRALSTARLLSFALLGGLSVAAGPAAASGEIPTASASAGAAPSLPPAALPELPHLQPITYPEPDPGALQDLDRLLERLTAEDERTRTNARAAVTEATPAFVPAIRHRVEEIRASLDRDAAPRMLEDARKAGRKALRDKDRKGDRDAPKPPKKDAKDKAHGDDAEDGDWLEFMLARPHPKDKVWQDLVRLLGMERMLTAIGTTPAVRELIALHGYFGDLLRVDLQRQIARLRDKAVPALLEARQSDAKVIQRWAGKELDALGRAIPGETVASNDTQILADVLRAYGRTRDVDAARVVLSFCNSDRIQLREAAREAVAAIGEPGLWQLRDQYLGLTGSKPLKDWAWDRIARELFGMYDRGRLAELYKLMDEGLGAAGAGKLEEATSAFDKVLARAPLFERRKEMVAAYVGRARALEGDAQEEALAMFRKALRLDPKGDEAKGIESEIAYLDGVLTALQGAPDRWLLSKAIELDPGNERARRALGSLGERTAARQTHLTRYGAAVAVGLAGLVAMLLLARLRPRDKGASEPPAQPKAPS
jgi:tetratricopeptide (TPR) repeat protein